MGSMSNSQIRRAINLLSVIGLAGWVLSPTALAETPPVLPAPERFSETELQVLQTFGAQLAACWDLDVVIEGPIDYVVSVTIRLGRDGWMDGEPELVYDWDDPILKDPVFQELADSTLNVLHACQPYVLPADLYEGDGGWRQIRVDLAPELLSANR